MADTLPSSPEAGEHPTAPTNALAVPAFRAFWLNGVTFFMAGNALRFVYGWVVLDGLGKGEAWQGLIVFILGMPSLFLLMPAGVWADRVDPKRLLIASQVGFAVVLAVTAVALGDGAGTTTLLVVSALVAGTASSIGTPVRQSLIPALLKGPLLYNGIALNAIAMTLSMVLGAVAARQFGDWFGFDGAFWWLVALLVTGIAALFAMRSPGIADAPSGARPSMRTAIVEGVRFVWDDAAIRTLFWLLAISGLMMTPIMFVTMQAHVKAELGRTAGDAAPVLALMGIGVATSSAYIMRRGDMADKGVKFMRAMIGGTSIVALMGLTTEYWQILVLGFLMGFCGGFFINMNQGLIQSNTPQPMMGRVMGLFALVQAGFTPLGAVGIGVLAERFGTGPAITAMGLVALSLVLITYTRAQSLRVLT